MRSVFMIAAGLAAAFAFVPSAQAGWLMYESPDYGFSALFPRTPSRQEQTSNEVVFTSFKAGNDAASCFVMVMQYPRAVDANNELLAIREASSKGMKATVSGSKSRMIARGEEQFAALEFEGDSEGRAFRSLIVIDGQRGYQVLAAVSKVDGDTAELEACIGGFVLTPRV